jgi:hypothetical protein
VIPKKLIVCQNRIALKYAFPNYNVHEASFIFQGHENNSASGSGALPADDQARIANINAVLHRLYGHPVNLVGQGLP